MGTVAGCGAAARFRREDGDLSARTLRVFPDPEALAWRSSIRSTTPTTGRLAS
jgi:hypothetical protein